MAEEENGDSLDQETGIGLIDAVAGIPIPPAVKQGLRKAVVNPNENILLIMAHPPFGVRFVSSLRPLNFGLQGIPFLAQQPKKKGAGAP